MSDYANFQHAYCAKRPEYGSVFAIGIGLNVLYVIVELFYGFKVNSAALIADAGHNASDVLSLVLSWVAIYLATKQPFGKFTYGLRKTTILAATVNGILIILAAVFILNETLQRIQHPVELPGNIIMKVAGVGILVNTITALLFIKGQKSDLNIKGTFLHMAADAAVSAGVLAGGFMMKLTGAYWIDPLLSFVIVVVIVFSAKGLLVDSFKLSVDAVPKEIDLERVRLFLCKQEGVKQVHDLHIWALSTTETCLTAHLVVPEGCDDAFLFHAREMLFNEFNITHSTLQVQSSFVENEYEYHPV
jgi:cobalt-zinc-cadmium efflux system protein